MRGNALFSPQFRGRLGRSLSDQRTPPMLAIPFPLETVPSATAADAVERLRFERPGTEAVLLGDADVFSVEWAETVDTFEDPAGILAEAAGIDADAWFAARKPVIGKTPGRDDTRKRLGWRVLTLPFDAAMAPARLIRWAATGERPAFLSDGSSADAEKPVSTLDALKAQLADLEASGEGDEEDLCEMREVIAAIEAEGVSPVIFPDPVDYVTPRHGDTLAAGLIASERPWETAAWLQHGTYALLAPKPVLVAHCRWLWETHGARIITASTDHIGFEVERPIGTATEAREVLARFFALCADEVNAENRGTDGTSLVGARRWWVWWD